MEQKTTPTADERVLALFKKLQAKKAEIAQAERPSFITGGQFRYSESMSNVIDITTVRDERKLVEIYAFLTEREKSHSVAAEALGVSTNFTWLTFTKEEWFSDLKTRVNILQIAKRKAEYAELEKKVNAIMSPELRAQMELDALEEILK